MYLTSYIKSLIISLTILILTTLVSVNSLAETATSGNLLPNAGDGRNNTQHSNSTVDGIDSSTGFTLNGITDFSANYNELEAQGTGTVSATGSLENITTTTQSGNSHTTTTTSLDGGVTLNATTEVQNCEWSGSSYQCGNAQSGTDSYSTTIKILDENENVLTSTSITRNNDAGYYNNTYTYTDTVTHNDTGARKWDWEWQGVDGRNPTTTNPDGPNLLGASLTATLLDITYQPITTEQQEDINEAVTEIEDAIEEIKFEEIENIKFEEVKLEEIKFEEVKIEEIELEEFEKLFEENFKQILIEENVMEEFETALIEEGLTEEEFFEEATNIVMEELKEEFEMEETNTFKEELNEETAMTEETQMEEVKEEEIKEEEIKEESKQEESNEPKPNTNEEIKEESNETNEKPEDSESVSNESEVVEDKETEGTKEEEADGENVESEAVESNETETNEVKVGSITEKVQKVLDKVLSKLKRVDQKLQAIQMVTSKGITSGEADISGYINKRIYTKQVALNGVPNPDFFQNLNILEQQQIYKDANLAAYVSNDPIAVKQKLLQEINVDKQRLLLELKALKNEG